MPHRLFNKLAYVLLAIQATTAGVGVEPVRDLEFAEYFSGDKSDNL